MTEPLAILLFEKVMPGSQLINRLQDLKYRVATLSDAGALLAQAEEQKPIVVIADLFSARNHVRDAIQSLRQNPGTAHIPVIAFTSQNDAQLLDQARAAGATLAVTEAAIVHHLPQLLDQALMEF